jgi:hypothetical protein
MAAGCRDCKRCTELGVTGVAMAPVRLFNAIFVNWWLNLFRRRCPNCGHPMSWHRMVEGRFQD